MSKKIKYFVGVVCSLFALALSMTVQASEIEKHGKGLIYNDNDKEILENLPEILNIKLNEQAIKNIKDFGDNELNQNIQKVFVVGKGEETITTQDAMTKRKNSRSQIEDDVVNQITSYDGSTSMHFPPIGDQGISGSCVAWAFGYYQMTNNIANIRGLDAKNNIKYRISPAWIHNLIKGSDSALAGAHFMSFHELVLKQGAPFWNDFSGETNLSGNRSWNPDVEVWEKALENRIDEMETLSVYNRATKQLELTNVKKLLLNGYVVSFASEFDKDLIFNDRIKFPQSHKNDYIMPYTVSHSGMHAITIVGWDDSLKIDIDGDGIIDSEGAFKVANSWGTNVTNHNKGFFWLAYDSILPESVIPSQANRVSSIDEQKVYFVKPKLSYKPLLLLQLKLKTENRRHLGIKIGASSPIDEIPKKYNFIFDKPYSILGMSVFKFKNYDNTNTYYDFYGNGDNKKDAEFIFDLTDTIVDFYGTSDKFISDRNTSFYVQIEDMEKDGYSSILKEVKIIDRVNNTQTNLSNLEIQVDGEKKEVKLNALVIPAIVDINKEFKLNFNYPVQRTSINTHIKVNQNGKLFNDIKIQSEDRKIISIIPLEAGYPRGNCYTIDLSNIKSDGGNGLTGKTKIDFYVP